MSISLDWLNHISVLLESDYVCPETNTRPHFNAHNIHQIPAFYCQFVLPDEERQPLLLLHTYSILGLTYLSSERVCGQITWPAIVQHTWSSWGLTALLKGTTVWLGIWLYPSWVQQPRPEPLNHLRAYHFGTGTLHGLCFFMDWNNKVVYCHSNKAVRKKWEKVKGKWCVINILAFSKTNCRHVWLFSWHG